VTCSNADISRLALNATGGHSDTKQSGWVLETIGNPPQINE
jgi:hypothetical protein